MVLAGCAGSQLGRGEGRWRVVETQHFKLHTDLQRDESIARARELERLLYAFENSAFQIRGELPLKLNVVMFGSGGAFEDFGRGDVGAYVVRDALFEPWLVMPRPTRGEGLTVLCHELTHHIAFQAMQRQPAWFAEGLASYFESARFDDDDSRFVVGKVPLHYHQALRSLRLIQPSELIGNDLFRTDEQFYGSAWLLVHYLMSRRGEQFASYQHGLAAGLGYTRAFQVAFAGLTLDELDREVESYFSEGIYEAASFPIANQANVPVSERVLGVAEEHALAGLLWASCPTCAEGARARSAERLQHALEADPTQLSAGALTIPKMADRDAALRAARQLADVHADQWLAWLTLGFTAQNIDPPTALSAQLADQASTRALTLAPSQAYAWMLRAIRLAAHGEREQALKAAARAHGLQRSAPNILLLYAQLLAQLSECAPLRELVERIHEQPELGIAKHDVQKLRDASAACTSERR